jgi:hypothetical protein
VDIDGRIHLGGEEEKVLTVVSLLKDQVRTRNETFNSINTDLRAFFEAKEDPLSSSALFLSLIVASEG